MHHRPITHLLPLALTVVVLAACSAGDPVELRVPAAQSAAAPTTTAASTTAESEDPPATTKPTATSKAKTTATGTTRTATSKAKTTAARKPASTTTKKTTEPAAAAPKPKTSTKKASTGTVSQRNALRRAKDYLDFKGFSRKGLIHQLSSSAGDGFPKADATWAVDHLTGVNWNEQAVRAGQAYLDFMGFSRQGLIDQLSSDAGDQFTKAQATYAADKLGL